MSVAVTVRDCRDEPILAARAGRRQNLTGYVTLARLLGVTLVTLDRAIGRAPGLHCPVATP